MSKIKYNDLLEAIALKVSVTGGASANSVNKYLEALYDVILEQLELNGSIYIENFGTFTLKERKGGSRIINNLNDDGTHLVYVEPKNFVSFKPSSVLDYCINEGNFVFNKRNVKSSKKKVSKKRSDYYYGKKDNKIKKHTDLMNLMNERSKQAKEINNNG